jgi:tetratricopeptide (TPR) repeat protein
MTQDVVYGRARDRLEEALVVAEDLGVCGARSETLYYFARLEQFQGNLEAAEEYYRRSLTLSREVGDSQGIAHVLFNAGEVALQRGRTDEAGDAFERSLELAREQDQHELARERYRDSVEHYREIDVDGERVGRNLPRTRRGPRPGDIRPRDRYRRTLIRTVADRFRIDWFRDGD